MWPLAFKIIWTKAEYTVVIQETHAGPVPGMHSVESVEAEQRRWDAIWFLGNLFQHVKHRGGTTEIMGGSLSDLSNQVKIQSFDFLCLQTLIAADE